MNWRIFNMFNKIIIPLFAVQFLLSGCTKSPTDADNRLRLPASEYGNGDTTSATSRVLSAPTIQNQPYSQQINYGQPVSFHVYASGNPKPTYQWMKNGVEILGADSSSYTISSVRLSDSGYYKVLLSNSQGNIISDSAHLGITPPAAPTIRPNSPYSWEPKSQPQSQTVYLNDSIVLSVLADGIPAPTYQWKKNGNNIIGADSSVLKIFPVKSSDSGHYTVVVSNDQGSVISDTAIVMVIYPGPPTILKQPTSQTVIERQPVTFQIFASGSAPLRYQWKNSGGSILGATSSSYSIERTALADSGNKYYCTITNSLGSITSDTVYLNVNTIKYCRHLVFEGNVLWVSSSAGLYKMTQNGIFTRCTTFNYGSIAIDSQGNKWLRGPPVNNKISLTKYDNNTFTIYSAGNISSADISSIAIDKQGNKWVGSFDLSGASKFNGTTWINYPNSVTGAGNINSITVDVQGNIWFGASRLTKFDGAVWTNYGDGNAPTGLYAVTVDAKGHVWCIAANSSFEDQGVAKYDGNSWIRYTSLNGAPRTDSNSRIAIDGKGIVWVSYGSNLYKYDGSTWTSITSNISQLMSITVDAQNNIWCGAEDGIRKYDGTKWTLYRY